MKSKWTVLPFTLVKWILVSYRKNRPFNLKIPHWTVLAISYVQISSIAVLYLTSSCFLQGFLILHPFLVTKTCYAWKFLFFLILLYKTTRFGELNKQICEYYHFTLEVLVTLCPWPYLLVYIQYRWITNIALFPW